MSCVVNFCTNRSGKGNREKGLKFYNFPKDPKQKVLWLKAARRWDLLKAGLNKHRRICNQHFVTGKFSLNPTHPDYVPSIFPFNKNREYRRIKERVQRFVRHEKRNEATGAPFVTLFYPGQQQGQKIGQLQGPKTGQQQGPKTGQQQGEKSGQQQGEEVGQKADQQQGENADQQQGEPPGPPQPKEPKDLLVHLPGYLKGQPPGGELFFRVPGPLPPGHRQIHLEGLLRGQKPGQPQGEDASRSFVLFLYNSPEGNIEQAVCMEDEIQGEGGETQEGDHTYAKHPGSAPVEPETNEPETPEREEARQSQEPGRAVTNTSSKEASQSGAGQNPKDPQDKPKEAQDSGNHRKPLLCPVCGQYYWSVLKFASHVQKHAAEYAFEGKPHVCQVCDKRFRLKRILEDHMAIHTGEKRFGCEYCDRRYLTKRSLRSHMRKHLAGFDCTYCDTSHRSEDALERHLLRCQARAERDGALGLPPRPKKFQCSECSKAFINQVNLDNHMNVHTGERTHHCSLCPKSFTLRKNLNRHLKLHTQEKRHSCSFCDKKFRRKQFLEEHVQTRHTGKTVLCHDCGKMFASLSQLKDHHARIHAQDRKRPFSCSVCLQAFETLETAQEHLEIHKKERAEKESLGESVELCDISVKFSGVQYLCNECGKIFYSRLNFKSHMRKVHTEDSFTCSACDLKFKRKISLTQHMMVHEGKNLYIFSCSVCPKSFRQKSSLDTHLLKHCGIKPFACNICDARFRCRTSLNSHANVHTVGQPFSCSKCPKRFKSMKNLDLHMRVTHRAGDYCCSYCQKTFLYESGLHTHVTIKHIMPSNHGSETLGADGETESAVSSISKVPDSLVDGAVLQSAGPSS